MCLVCYVGLPNRVEPYRCDRLSVAPVAGQPPSCLDGFALGELLIAGHQQPGDAFSCACALPHVLADESFSYYDGMFSEDKLDQNEVVTSRLVEWIRQVLGDGEQALLFPVEDPAGSLAAPPRGTVELVLDDLSPRELFFVEGFLYRLSR